MTNLTKISIFLLSLLSANVCLSSWLEIGYDSSRTFTSRDENEKTSLLWAFPFIYPKYFFNYSFPEYGFFKNKTLPYQPVVDSKGVCYYLNENSSLTARSIPSNQILWSKNPLNNGKYIGPILISPSEDQLHVSYLFNDINWILSIRTDNGSLTWKSNPVPTNCAIESEYTIDPTNGGLVIPYNCPNLRGYIYLQTNDLVIKWNRSYPYHGSGPVLYRPMIDRDGTFWLGFWSLDDNQMLFEVFKDLDHISDYRVSGSWVPKAIAGRYLVLRDLDQGTEAFFDVQSRTLVFFDGNFLGLGSLSSVIVRSASNVSRYENISGDPVWTRSLSQIGLDEKTSMFASVDGNGIAYIAYGKVLYALDIFNGSLLWNLTYPTPINVPVISDSPEYRLLIPNDYEVSIVGCCSGHGLCGSVGICTCDKENILSRIFIYRGTECSEEKLNVLFVGVLVGLGFFVLLLWITMFIVMLWRRSHPIVNTFTLVN